jgi:hypothetical protein
MECPEMAANPGSKGGAEKGIEGIGKFYYLLLLTVQVIAMCGMENDNDNEWHHTPLVPIPGHYASTRRHVTNTISNNTPARSPYKGP